MATTEASKNQAQSNQKNAGLLDLPPEIWSKICKPLATYDHPISIYTFFVRDKFATAKINYWSYDGSVGGMPKTVEPAITRVCCPIREECIAAFYSTNVFAIYDNTEGAVGLAWWLDVIGAEHREHLQHVYFETPMSHPDLFCEGEWTAALAEVRPDGRGVLSLLKDGGEGMKRVLVDNL